MFSTNQVLKLLKEHSGLEAICVEGETEFGSCVDWGLTFFEGEFILEEPNDWDNTCTEVPSYSIPKNLKWMIDISNRED